MFSTSTFIPISISRSRSQCPVSYVKYPFDLVCVDGYVTQDCNVFIILLDGGPWSRHGSCTAFTWVLYQFSYYYYFSIIIVINEEAFIIIIIIIVRVTGSEAAIDNPVSWNLQV